MSAAPGQDAIADRLRNTQVGLRPDLEVHRHVFRGEVSYVIRDPMTLAVHKLSEGDYQLCAAIDEDRQLGDVFNDLLKEGVVDEEDEENFYQFVLGLHGLGFLNLPVPDNASLYKRRQQKIIAKRKAKMMGFLFMQVPLFNPDTFLERTQHLVSWIFTKWMLAIWLVVVASALTILINNWGEFFTPIGDVFTPERMLGMWIALVLLKVIHEFGHAYACKHFGGEVPEIGAYFIAGTPCAYCDCTSSWGFTKRSERLIVVLGGVYVELFIAALAIFVWATASSATTKLMAFDIVVVAGVATLLANLNPLMRFDGYYILSDVMEIPNLRSTAQRRAIGLLKRVCVGVHQLPNRYGPAINTFLVTFGVMSSLYKIVIVMGISALLATKFLYLGIGLAVFYGSMEFYKAAKGVGGYLLHSEEAKSHRIRAGVLATMLFAIAPAFLVFVPIPRPVMATARVGMENERSFFAPTDGFVEESPVHPGAHLKAGDTILTIETERPRQDIMTAEHDAKREEILAAATIADDPAQSAVHRQSAASARARLERAKAQLDELTIRAVEDSIVIQSLPSSRLGGAVMLGEPIATIGSGKMVLSGLVREAALASVHLEVGDEIEFRTSSHPDRTFRATITHLGQLGSRAIVEETLTAMGGGDIPISPVTGEANEPYFEIEAVLEGDPHVVFGVTGKVKLGTHAEPIATTLWRSGLRLLQKLEQK